VPRPSSDELATVSVITVVKNDAEGLARTARSVAAQSYGQLEHVIVDGASSDDTRGLLGELRATGARVHSEPDSGIAQAFNRGLALARGDWINFLNAGDVYRGSDVVERAMEARDGRPIVTGFARFGRHTIPARPLRPADPLTRRARLSHQASFVHRSVFERAGGFDERFRVRMDYELWLRVLREHALRFVEEEWVDFEPGGVSGSDQGAYVSEERRAHRMHLRVPALANARGSAHRAALRLAHDTRLGRAVRRLRGRS
jgi:glycosyltransferase involved in cell wall biosynthesis